MSVKFCCFCMCICFCVGPFYCGWALEAWRKRERGGVAVSRLGTREGGMCVLLGA